MIVTTAATAVLVATAPSTPSDATEAPEVTEATDVTEAPLDITEAPPAPSAIPITPRPSTTPRAVTPPKIEIEAADRPAPAHSSGRTIAFPNPPARVATVGRIQQIASGRLGAALAADGTVWAWEPDAGWRMRSGKAPYQVEPLSTPIQLVGGTHFPLLIGADGTLTTWMQKGSRPERVPSLTDVVAAAAGTHHVVALHRNGTVSLVDRFYTLGAPPKPVPVPGLSDVVAVAAGPRDLSVALLRSGELWSWRYRTSKLEFGPTLEIHAPKTQITDLRQLPPVEDAVAIAVRDTDILVLDRGGTVHYAPRSREWRRFDSLPRIAALRAHSDATAALDVHGGVWTWGRFGFSHKDAMDVPKPAKVEGLPRAVAIDVDTRQSLALDAQGGLWVWGPTTTCDRYGPEGETSCQ